LHFAAFRGNVELLDNLVENGANIYLTNNFGINVLHVASQGDQPISLYYFRSKNMDITIKDNRGSTPLHWACYSKSEVALCYLLAWVQNVDCQDVEGLTPLHLAVKSVETLKSSRPVRTLLIRGANRDVKDNNGKTPIEHVENISNLVLQNELRSMLKEPHDCSCLMLKTPLKLTRKSPKTSLLFGGLIIFNYLCLLILIFPCNHLLKLKIFYRYKLNSMVPDRFIRIPSNSALFCHIPNQRSGLLKKAKRRSLSGNLSLSLTHLYRLCSSTSTQSSCVPTAK